MDTRANKNQRYQQRQVQRSLYVQKNLLREMQANGLYVSRLKAVPEWLET